MDILQQLIHKLEVGGGMRYFRAGMIALAVVLLGVGYNWRAFRNMSSQEAMDAAQLARNIAGGKGYTTHFIRPFSMFLVKRHFQETHGVPALGSSTDLSRIKGPHPDLANPPVYPVLLAGLMKVLPFEYNLPTKPKPFWSVGGSFYRYQPDFLIALFNQVLFLGLVVLIFFLAQHLFDRSVAWLSAALVLGSELLWRFSVTGLSTLLLLVIFVGLVWCLVLWERETREPRYGPAALWVLSAAAGLLVGIGALTRYSFGWLIIAVVLFLIIFGGRRWMIFGALAFVVFAAVMAPWIVRNYQVSGTPFGTAGYAIMQASVFQEHRLERSLDPDFSRVAPGPFWHKLFINSRQIIQGDLPKLGGTWLSAFFLVGLMVGFRNPAATRLRYFLVSSLVILVVAQALGKTQLSEDSPDLNSENLLVLLAPLVVIYGVSLFFVLLDQIELPIQQLRYPVIGVFAALASLPLILVFLPPKSSPLAYPPYYPPAIENAAGWAKADELTMSDIPWAMAWYGQRQSIWLTLNCQADFLSINDYQKPVQALYLSRGMLDSRFLSQWLQGGDESWGNLVLSTIFGNRPPISGATVVNVVQRGAGNQPFAFPLHYWQIGWPNQFLLTARELWPK